MVTVWDQYKGTRMHVSNDKVAKHKHLPTRTFNKKNPFCTWDNENGISGFEKFTTWDFGSFLWS